MQQVISIIGQHGLLVVFVNILLSQGGMPIPAIPTLMMAAALAGQSRYQVAEIILVGVIATLIGDSALYWGGRRYGRRILGLVCKVSFSPDFCVRQTETVFAKVGHWSLVFAKFLPGLSIIAVAMAGVTRMSVLAFLVFDGVGGFLYVGAAVALGLLFQNAIADALSTLANLGEFGVVAVLGVVGLYMLAKWLRRRLFIRQLRMDRITVAELRRLIDDGQSPIILDVRPPDVRAQEGIIPGAIPAHAADIDPDIMNYPREREIVVYCACPNEESAATAAKHLKQAGFKKIRPLLGGIDAWVQAGHSLEGLPLEGSPLEGLPLEGLP
jgi:membrane protein DedA with SNARE-associated domain/rhodanese-related sulfurtransferase